MHRSCAPKPFGQPLATLPVGSPTLRYQAPEAFYTALSKHCEAGAAKYGERNIDKGAPLNSLLSSGGRHLGKYIQGEQDEDHLVAACWNLMWALQQRTTHPELNNLPWSEYYVPVGPKKDEQGNTVTERAIPDNLTDNAKMALNSLYTSAKRGVE